MDIDKDISNLQREHFKAFMQQRGLNPSSWAKKSGVTESTIRHFLSGRNQSLTGIILEKLARSANASINELIGGSNLAEAKNAIISFNRDLMLKAIEDAEEYINKSDLKILPKDKANIFLTWYDLTQLLKQDNLEENEAPIESVIKALSQKTG